MTSKTREELESEVHPTLVSLIKAAADRWTTENLGGHWPRDRWQDQSNEDLDVDELDDFTAGLQGEYDEWFKHAQKMAKELTTRELPLTLANMELAFQHKLDKQEFVAVAK